MLVNGALGLCGESGEFADAVKKQMFQGHDLDIPHLIEELGDIAWYIAVASHALGYKLEDVLTINIEKLKRRYPNGFDTERSVNREV